jgi:hypothetical protein
MELSKSEWAEHVETWRCSGKTATAYCEERGLKYGALRYWSGRIGRERPGPRAKTEVRFAAIRREPATATARPAKPATPANTTSASRPTPSSRSGVHLQLGGAQVELEVGFDDETLSRVVAVLTAGEGS